MTTNTNIYIRVIWWLSSSHVFCANIHKDESISPLEPSFTVVDKVEWWSDFWKRRTVSRTCLLHGSSAFETKEMLMLFALCWT
mmetsp:Transcript_14498/g.26208  ORF Transcript_14498/g.26208 Transcript_14498/m.26208 type:complete len:83 (+) Transcript_14498:100-348(+)